MPTLRITKEFRFEAAHALKGYNGPCQGIHGHSYKLSVTVAGTPSANEDSPKYGMVMDFGDLKKIIRENIVDPLDHALILKKDYPADAIQAIGKTFCNVVWVPYQPTSENLLTDFASRIIPLLPEGVRLVAMKLRETATSFAEWLAEDPAEKS